MDYRTYLRYTPDAEGRFGEYGGAILPDELKAAFAEITEAYQTNATALSSFMSCAASAGISRAVPPPCIIASG